MTVEIETLENARYELDQWFYPHLLVEVNGRLSDIIREKALRLDREIAALGEGFTDFTVIVRANDEQGIGRGLTLPGYTNDRRYVALVKAFCEAVDSGAFTAGRVNIPK